ncbi:MAG: cytochrome c biogenesis protein [Chloroflexota bacterium]|jgi:heme exporter protein C|nr:cytochrome c biogenesis protein [Chloroflexota bacterium]
MKAVLALTLLAIGASQYMIFGYAPEHRVQGNLQRVFYAHVSTALISYIAFIIVAIGGGMYLARRNVLWDRIARASALIGVVFTTIVLATGCIWGTGIWGACWTWDPRLTTTLVLWFIYVGYLMLRGYIDERERKRRVAAVVGIAGAVIVPINYLSVYWWRTLHPPSTLISGGSGGLEPPMLQTLIVSAFAFLLLFGVLIRLQARLERLSDSVEDLRMAAMKREMEMEA